MHSIAIPAIGIGEINLKANQIAQEMIQVALNFAEHREKNLRKIHFIIYPTDENVYSAFKKALFGTSIEIYTSQQLVEMLTISQKDRELDHKRNSLLLFKAQCKAAKVPVDIHVFHGIVDEVKTDAIIDMTALCSKHNSTDNHVDFADYYDANHISQTLRYQRSSNQSIYQVCPYGYLAGFSSLLSLITTRGEKSVTIPLLDVEMKAVTIDCLINLIESYIKNHIQNRNSINCFDFVIGYQNRSTEIATWIQDKITNKLLQFKWTVLHKVSIPNFGMNIHYVASNRKDISNMKSRIATYKNAWAYHEIVDEDYFNNLEPKLWYQLALKIWSKYNTIINRQEMNKSISIFGYKADIINTVSHIFKERKICIEEKLYKEIQQFATQTTQWYLEIGLSRFKFEAKLNYELEKNYKIYSNGNTREIVYIDSDTKIVDYGNMKIKDVDKRVECSISKSAFQGIV